MKSQTMKLCRVGVLAGLSALTALLAACGDDVTNSTTNMTGAKTVADLSAAGKCDSSALGELVLNAEDGGLYVCNGKEWISMKGEGGESGCDLNSIEVDGVEGVEIVCGNAKDTVLNGRKGDKGGAGAPGDSGTSCVGNKIAEGLEIVCDGVVLDTLTDGAAGEGCSSRKFLDAFGAPSVIVTCGDASDTLYSSKGSCGARTFDAATLLCDVRDNRLYRHVTIGGRVWMAENLNHEYRVEGATYGNWCYRNNADYCARFGRLYAWSAAMDSATTGCGKYADCAADSGKVRGVCPEGWHLPSSAEWNALIDTVGGASVAGKMLKSTEGWDDGHVGDDVYGFAALGTGYLAGSYDMFIYDGLSEYFWSSSDVSETAAYTLGLSISDAASVSNGGKSDGFSVRCVKD